MNPRQSSRKRLDQILIEQGAVTEAQVAEALLRQRAHGGKFGSHLLYFRFITETDLANALAVQFECDAVVLSNTEIPEDVIAAIPQRIALARRVVPFELDSATNTLKIACEDPADPQLMNELGFAARGKKIKLYVTPEISLTTALDRYYRGLATGLEDRLQLALPDVIGDQSGIADSAAEPPEQRRPAVLLITTEMFATPLLQSIFERDHYEVVVTSSFEEAEAVLKDQEFETVFVQSNVPGDPDAFAELLTAASIRTRLRTYTLPTELILGDQHVEDTGRLMLSSLTLFTTLLAGQKQGRSNHGGRVGHYAETLCRRLYLPTDLRLRTAAAGFLHDLARVYYDTATGEDKRTVVQLSRRLLASVNYPDPTLRLLDAMYANSEAVRDLSYIEIFAGQILTIADLYCESVPPDDRLSLDRFESIKKKLRDLAGRIVEPRIVETFIHLLQEEVLNQQVACRHGQVMIFARDQRQRQSIELRLHTEGFRLIATGSPAELGDLYARSAPDTLLLVAPGDSHAVKTLFTELADLGFDLGKVPTLLLVDRATVSTLTTLLDRGVEDILAIDGNLDFLVSKLSRLHDRIQQAESSGAHTTGARGRLTDMNLVDLLQALGPGRRTVKITVSPAGKTPETLTLYLQAGEITYAECNELSGPEAIYHAITWTEGQWTVEPVAEAHIPERNNHIPNDGILMEGCRLLDERLRSGQL